MQTNRDDFIIAIRSAFLKKGTQQRFSLIALILFSIFLNSIIIKPIRKLTSTAQNIDANVKQKPLIKSLDKREDEIGQLSKIINNILNNLYSKIDNAENNSADLMHEIRNPLASIKMASEVITCLLYTSPSPRDRG